MPKAVYDDPETYRDAVNSENVYKSLESDQITVVIGSRYLSPLKSVQEATRSRDWVKFQMNVYNECSRITNRGLKAEIERRAGRKIGDHNKIKVVILEAQQCPELFEQIRQIYDEYNGSCAIKFVLTGSAPIDLYNHCKNTLSRRIDVVNFAYWHEE